MLEEQEVAKRVVARSARMRWDFFIALQSYAGIAGPSSCI
jgi:hypothetical protein